MLDLVNIIKYEHRIKYRAIVELFTLYTYDGLVVRNTRRILF